MFLKNYRRHFNFQELTDEITMGNDGRYTVRKPKIENCFLERCLWAYEVLRGNAFPCHWK